ncbi:hypothetical protein RHMOL_Rhmol02G0121600 [Rhododendron molle]|uniref:Uncharacterized protein n=1 Tax=Rhododendron molle TaxID=49168 RepID=A0ACC0PPL4_RHOML|nr:hypothetical protein RHMOL_Rhmol02G0121600 [Rhododendron molle]
MGGQATQHAIPTEGETKPKLKQRKRGERTEGEGRGRSPRHPRQELPGDDRGSDPSGWLLSFRIRPLNDYLRWRLQDSTIVTKEREIEIGYPTDVKHVAHIGWDGPSGTAPTWMNEFNTASNFAATSIGNINEARGSSSAISTWSSQDYESMDRQPMSDQMLKDALPPTDLPKIPKKQKRKKTKLTSSPKSSSSSSRSSRAAKSKSKFVESNAKTSNIEVM